MTTGDQLTLTVEKPAAGGRMLARHEGAVVLVAGAIPGEVVHAEVERVQRGTAWARVTRVVTASPDRVTTDSDGACGGNVLGHVGYERQLTLKREIIEDAFRRIGRMSSPEEIAVEPSPTDGYRMRARLHVVNGRVGFFREGTHQLCDVAMTRQLLPATIEVIRALEGALTELRGSAVVEAELSENCAADQRALHLLLRDDTDASRMGTLQVIDGVRGVSCGPVRGGRPLVLWGNPEVEDAIVVPASAGAFNLKLTRQAHAFFQGNRYLLATLVAAVVDQVAPGRVLDLYAGVGLFAVALALQGGHEVMAIEGDAATAQDLKRNATRAGREIDAHHQSVESFLGSRRLPGLDTVIVDPPRTGMSKEALRSALALRAGRVVYVSCDVATLARDARILVDAGYRLSRVRAFDLFPNTAHVETLAVFIRGEGQSAAEREG
jgi:23S rRNA (uracil1939-C5)-methyltransferase